MPRRTARRSTPRTDLRAGHQVATWRPALYALSALVLLLALGAWGRVGGLTAVFWRELALLAGSASVAGALAWWAVLQPAAPLHRAGATIQRVIIAVAPLAGLALVAGASWLAATGTTTEKGEAGPWGAVLIGAGSVLLTTAAAFQATRLRPPPTWRTRRLTLREVNVIVLLSAGAALLLANAAPAGLGLSTMPQEASRWSFPAVVAGVALFCGQVALQLVRRPGAAMMLFAAVLLYRALANFLLAQTYTVPGSAAAAEFLALVPAVLMDAFYMVRLPEADAPRTLRSALLIATIATVTTALLMAPQLFGAAFAVWEIVGAASAGLLIGVWCGQCGAVFGAWVLSRQH